MSFQKNKQFIKYLKIIMLWGGLWQKPLTNLKINMFYKFYLICMKTSLYFSLILTTVEFLRLIIEGYDTELVVASLAVIVNVIKVTAKIAIYLKNGVFNFFDDVIRKEKNVWADSDGEIKTFYLKKIKECRRFVLVQAFCSAIATITLHVTGIIGNQQIIEYNKSHNDTLETHYCYQIWLPFSKLDHLFLYYSIQFVFAWAGTTYNTISHIVPSVLLIFTATQLQILQIRIRKFLPDDMKNVNVEEKPLELKHLITEHQYCIKFAENLNKAIRNIILMEYILSSIDIASVVTSLIKIETNEIGMNLTFVMLLSTQTFILGWTANEVKIQSKNITDAAFESNWYLLEKKGASMLQFIMLRAQKPLVISIGPFAAMTIQSALAIMRVAYSYVSIMRQ